ncbi:hypothetical protein BAY61_01610 [Prauserella marina]|uniref:Uncharacterized protein n=1 Tax=Prauserella marina TaxID=530584 RepID=A0A222VJ92_9PSEU|nr:hypothetical protein [Prauserella marina]ASR33902.1 hypothetical protein BAY61_01610 [Prauserella marina]PWV82497.1 hypothetical protein DES30_102740 [Prauserella marina]SDC70595.1 hypothetical protein SAMN05421630_103276 [Prauserella marina]
MTTNTYLAFLGLGVVMVVLDGQILYHSGKRYLSAVDGGSESSGSMARLVAVLFHLVLFGVLALLSVLNFSFGGGALRAVVGNLGLLLVLIAGAHAVTMAVFAHVRDARMAEEGLSRPANTAYPAGSAKTSAPVVTPVPGQPGRDPRMSPTIEDRSG